MDKGIQDEFYFENVSYLQIYTIIVKTSIHYIYVQRLRTAATRQNFLMTYAFFAATHKTKTVGRWISTNKMWLENVYYPNLIVECIFAV